MVPEEEGRVTRPDGMGPASATPTLPRQPPPTARRIIREKLLAEPTHNAYVTAS